VVEEIARSGGVGIVVLKGMGGVGKTALAVKAADKYKRKFKCAVWSFDLGCHSGSPKKADDMLATLLGDIAGFNAETMPRDEDGRKREWQRWTAKKQMLLILENVSRDTPVQDLIPRHGKHLILITTRNKLNINSQDFAVRPREVDVGGLEPEAALKMFEDVVGADRGLDESDFETAAELLERCGHLPMAISVLAARLRDGTTTVTQAREDFVHAAEALGVIEVTAPGEGTISAAIRSAYLAQADEDKRVLCQLALHPRCPDIDIPVAAALTDLSTPVNPCLQRLYDASLLEVVNHRENAGAGPRYKLHDLVCDYVRKQTAFSEAESFEIMDRLFTHYWCTARETAAWTEPFLTRHTRPDVDPNRNRICPSRSATGDAILPKPAIDARAETLNWFDQHRAHLLACLDHATEHHLHGWIVSLTSVMAGFLRNHGPWDQAITLHDQAVRAAGELAHAEAARAVALNDQGIMFRLTGDYANAIAVLRMAQSIFSLGLPELSERDALLGQANALNEQGIVHNLLGERENDSSEYDQAVDVLVAALKRYRKIGDDIGQANATKNLGVAKYSLGLLLNDAGLSIEAEAPLKEAEALLEEAMKYYGQIGDGDELGLVEVLNHQGFLRLRSDNVDGALSDFTEAMNLVNKVGSLLEKARSLEGVGLRQAQKGATDDAVIFLEEAKDIYSRIGAKKAHDNVTEKLNELRVRQMHGRRSDALRRSAGYPRAGRTRQ
jgi:tetratricopeptide (TPR) repeat protein